MKVFPKPLSTKEERKYLLACKNGDMQARDQLIQHNLRLVAHIVKKYHISASDVEDFISIGTIGLMKAIDSFQIDKGIRLATYASCCIENEMLMVFRSEKKLLRNVSLSEPIGSDQDGNEICIEDIIAIDPVDIVDKLELRDNKKKLSIYIDEVLSVREKEILILRYGLYGKKEKTQREVAEYLNISRSYVSRIEKKAIEKLRECYQRRE